MRIILEAFNGQLRSNIMDIPEGSGHTWRMVLMQPDIGLFSAKTGASGEEILTHQIKGFGTECVFEWTGQYMDKVRDPRYGIRVYKLIDIEKKCGHCAPYS